MTIEQHDGRLDQHDQPQRHGVRCARSPSPAAARGAHARRASSVGGASGSPSTSTTAPAGTCSSNATVSPSSPHAAWTRDVDHVAARRGVRHLRGRLRMDRGPRPRAQLAQSRVVRQRAAAGEDRRLDDHAQRIALDHRARRSYRRPASGRCGGGAVDEHARCAPRSRRATEARCRALRPAQPACRRRPTLRPGAGTPATTGSTSPARFVVVPVFSKALHAGSTSVAQFGRLGHEQIADDDERRRPRAPRAPACAIGPVQHRVHAQQRERGELAVARRLRASPRVSGGTAARAACRPLRRRARWAVRRG